jgi:UPF0755 protein
MPSSTEKKTARPKKRRRSAFKGFRLFSWLLALFVLSVIGAIAWAFLPAGNNPQKTTVEIPDQATARQIGGILRRRGMIRSETAFLLMARFLGEAGHMQAGDYEVSPRMTLAQIITLLSRGDSLAEWVTIPEGYTLRQITRVLHDKKLADSAHFQRIARVGGRSFRNLSFTPPDNLEGFLFPDTYKIRRNTPERKILHTMLDTFDDKVAKPLKAKFEEAARQGRSMEDVIILASMVEREARAKKEQPIIAGVLMNRLRQGMKLQVDATVQYALAAPKRRLLYTDLEVASPYNTYKIKGLPPGPICSPGLGAIEAALRPANVQALYYVAKPDGTHIFSRTLDEHNAARALVKRLAKESP